MLQNKIDFKYYNPRLNYFTSVIIVSVMIFTSRYFLLHHPFPIAIKYMFVTLVLFIWILRIGVQKHQDMPGSFRFEPEGFEISTMFKKDFIPYSDIMFIRKEYYDRVQSLGMMSATQPIVGQYTITLKNNKSYKLRIAKSEVSEYQKAIKKLIKKIYNTEIPLVALTSSYKKGALSNQQKDEQFERERPVPNYTLDIAIDKLLSESGTSLVDLTM